MILSEVTVTDILEALDRRGLKHWIKDRYIITQCPLHDDRNPSAQIYLDDFFLNCHVCGRFGSLQVFKELRDSHKAPNSARKGQLQAAKTISSSNTQTSANKASKHPYRRFDLFDYWSSLQPLADGIKGIPAYVLNDMGWRVNDGKAIAGEGIFIPYFTYDHPAFSQNQAKIPFAQVRHPKGYSRRFSFLKDAYPAVYGLWNLDYNSRLFIVEGSSDCAVMEYCGVPWIGLPSASSVEQLRWVIQVAEKRNIELIYAGDNDDAGNRLLQALNGQASYRFRQAPKKYKDYGEFFEAEGMDAVIGWCDVELYL